MVLAGSVSFVEIYPANSHPHLCLSRAPCLKWAKGSAPWGSYAGAEGARRRLR